MVNDLNNFEKLNKKVTVLMPVYNAEKYLKDSINSILNQTYKEFDLLIINDGSTDNSASIIKECQDCRIKYVENKSNIGLIDSLNNGLSLIRSKYIVRMDADDISCSKRLEKQVLFMDENPEIVVAGSAIKMFIDWKFKIKYKKITDSQKLRVNLLFNCELMHPTCIIRKEIIDQENYRYNTKHKNVEDFGLWQLISFKYRVANMSEVLLYYRVVSSSVTKEAEKDKVKRRDEHIMVFSQALNYLSLDEKYSGLLYDYSIGKLKYTNKNLIELRNVLSNFYVATKSKYYDTVYLKEVLSGFFYVNSFNNNLGIYQIKQIYSNYFYNHFPFSLIGYIKTGFKLTLKKYFNRIPVLKELI